ncbi:hypothetical protein H206_00536 [Candidatus Electrothrix aarhusensis]|jgi:hypothetical protein|uniref:Uncharacterized protein n=1 Tax=Candidatus Electrothrix aarhusensis TaxID=1859131 RepID=A0A3S3QH87_9BACT|nr:hypothetical protein H206_00536 [Candidatus Electrothrix aarhusensis]
MKEEKVTKLNMDAVLTDDELVKKLAAKVLDMIRQKPDSGVVCQGYYCDMDKEVPIKEIWANKLNTLDMKIEEGLAESAADEYPLNADELDQVVTEIKTSDAYAEKLSGNDLSQAVGKVLADNEMMRRKGGLMSKKNYNLEYNRPVPDCRVDGLCRVDKRHIFPCRVEGPNNPIYEYCTGGHGLKEIDPQERITRPELIRIVEAIVPKAVADVLNQAGALSRTTYR